MTFSRMLHSVATHDKMGIAKWHHATSPRRSPRGRVQSHDHCGSCSQGEYNGNEASEARIRDQHAA